MNVIKKKLFSLFLFYEKKKVEEKKNGGRNLFAYINLGDVFAECVHFLFLTIREYCREVCFSFAAI